MTTRLLLAIPVIFSLAVSGCSSNRCLCRRLFNQSDGGYCCNQPLGNCGCTSCRMNRCSMGGCPNCQGGMCSSCEGGSCSMGSSGSAMYSEYGGGEMMNSAEFPSAEGGYVESGGTPTCNCGAQ